MDDVKKKHQQGESCYRDTMTKSHTSNVHRRPTSDVHKRPTFDVHRRPPNRCSLHPRLGQHGGVGVGVGRGGVGCNYVLAQGTRIGRSLGIHFHLLAHCIHVLVSMEGVGWRWGWGGVRCNNIPCTSLPLTCSRHPRWGGVWWGSGAITFLALEVTASTSW